MKLLRAHDLKPFPFDPVAVARLREQIAAEKKDRKPRRRPPMTQAQLDRARENLVAARAKVVPVSRRCQNPDCLKTFEATRANGAYCSKACLDVVGKNHHLGLTPEVMRRHLQLLERRAAGDWDHPKLTPYALALVSTRGERDTPDSLLAAASCHAEQRVSVLAEELVHGCSGYRSRDSHVSDDAFFLNH